MVPPESFSTEAPHSSNAFCNGCDGGTQCESLSSKVFSWAIVRVDPPIRAANAAAQTHAAKRNIMEFLPRFKCWLGSQLFYYSAACRRRCKAYSLISNYMPDGPFWAVNRGRKWRV